MDWVWGRRPKSKMSPQGRGPARDPRTRNHSMGDSGVRVPNLAGCSRHGGKTDSLIPAEKIDLMVALQSKGGKGRGLGRKKKQCCKLRQEHPRNPDGGEHRTRLTVREKGGIKRSLRGQRGGPSRLGGGKIF